MFLNIQIDICQLQYRKGLLIPFGINKKKDKEVLEFHEIYLNRPWARRY